jgi:HD-GYP domain-containing protein (c-di-GMP phosphodiesterase class II)
MCLKSGVSALLNSDNQQIEAVAQSLIDNAPDYVKSVAAMAESHELSATADVVSASGIKLVARGARIDQHLYEKLSGHRLSGIALEQSIAIAGSATPELIATDISHLIDQDGWLQSLSEKSGDPGAMRHGVSHLALHPQILFRLTVAREQRPELYRHTLCVTIISHYISQCLQLKQSSINNVLVAALCHDLGELYTDPMILEPGYRVTDEERRFIYVHPITGWLITRQIPGIDPEITKAIIQHQERLDGSGYPFGIRGNAITLAGRILAAADVSASIMLRFSDHRRLSTLLRLNSNKYDSKVVAPLHAAFFQKAPVAKNTGGEVLKKQLTGFARLLDGWSSLRSDSVMSQTIPVIFLTERIYNLRTVILASGFDPDSLEVPLELAEEDETIAAEMATVVDELQFQLADLKREIDRHEVDWMPTLDPRTKVAFEDWNQHLRNYVNG